MRYVVKNLGITGELIRGGIRGHAGSQRRKGGTVECFGEGAAILLFFNPARARFESGIPKGV